MDSGRVRVSSWRSDGDDRFHWPLCFSLDRTYHARSSANRLHRCLVDHDDADARDELLAELDLLRTDIERLLAGEEEIWVTISPIGIVRR